MSSTTSSSRIPRPDTDSKTHSPPCAGFFMGERLDLALTTTPLNRETIMATTKKSGSSKKPAPKKSGFFPPIKSTKKTGKGVY